MTCDRMGKWQMIVEGANTYSPDPVRKAQRRRMERHVFRDRGILIATDYLVNAGGVIYAAYERIIPTPATSIFQRSFWVTPAESRAGWTSTGLNSNAWRNSGRRHPWKSWKPLFPPI
jgi:hypothetical protein